MKIEDAGICMTANRNFRETEERRQQIRAWVAPDDRTTESDRVRISENAKCLKAKQDEETSRIRIEEHSRYGFSLESLLLEILFGQKVKILDPSAFQPDGEKAPKADDLAEMTKDEQSSEAERVGWGLDVHISESRRETEDVTFVAAGVVRTQDRGDVAFSLHLNMHREFVSRHELNLRAGDAALVDPLVINFNGTAAELQDARFAFDLDTDEIEEQIPKVRPGSGILTLDKDGNGAVTDGTELFGPRTGDGFQELSAYDEDGNDWIDENDAVYERLRVWTMNPDGGFHISSLKDKGIGAIHLKSLSSQFYLKDGNNKLQGQVQKTGIFLKEDGTAGSIQQLDLAV